MLNGCRNDLSLKLFIPETYILGNDTFIKIKTKILKSLVIHVTFTNNNIIC